MAMRDLRSMSGHRVVAAAPEGVAAGDAPKREPHAEEAVALDGFARVLRARGREAALAAPGEGNEALVCDDRQRQDALHARGAPGSPACGIGASTPAEVIIRSTSLARSWCAARSAERDATSMIREPVSCTRDQRRTTASSMVRRARCAAPRRTPPE